MSIKTVIVNGMRVSPRMASKLAKKDLHFHSHAEIVRLYGSKQDLRKLLIIRHGTLCMYCKVEMHFRDKTHPAYATIEHVHPLAKGGGNHLGNLGLACRKCNSSRV